MKKFWMTFSRLLVGAVFIFSGFVKGVDPLGTAYKFGDYFAAYGTDWANAFALFLSVSLCALEFAIGAALFFNLRMKITAWALLIIMMFFTVLTFFDAIYAPVPDCGCFGDAIKLTNWETFYKNLVLMIFVIVIFRNRTSFKSVLSNLSQNIVLVLISAMFIYFSVYNYRHLPMIDFRMWKVGNKMTADADNEMRVYVKYRNIATGEIREYLSPDFPWNDPVWLAEWEF
ncbi:MAG: DoxX family protein, partial [Bacteroidales bacterium]|nr:DoxX family protein [Bacteroidales bacterium]